MATEKYRNWRTGDLVEVRTANAGTIIGRIVRESKWQGRLSWVFEYKLSQHGEWRKGEALQSTMTKVRVRSARKNGAKRKSRASKRDWKPLAGRLVKRVGTAKVYKDTDWEEYVVVPAGAKSDKRAAFTDSKDDALAIAADMDTRASKARTNGRRRNSKPKWVPATSPNSKPGDLMWTGAAPGDHVEILQLPKSAGGYWLPWGKIGAQSLNFERAYRTPQAAKRVAVSDYRITKAAWTRKNGRRR